MSVKPRGVGGEDSFTLFLQFVELAAVEGPGEDGEDAEHEHGRQRDQEIQDVHGVRHSWRDRRSELRTTPSELAAMPRPASHGGSQPASASGTQARL